MKKINFLIVSVFISAATFAQSAVDKLAEPTKTTFSVKDVTVVKNTNKTLDVKMATIKPAQKLKGVTLKAIDTKTTLLKSKSTKALPPKQ